MAEYLVVVEDPDAPLPQPVVHGIYYPIPSSKMSLNSEDLKPVVAKQWDELKGCRYGLNRMKNIWGDPRPVLGHGFHRYMFQVVGLKTELDKKAMSELPTRADIVREVEGKVAVWGTWVGRFERTL